MKFTYVEMQTLRRQAKEKAGKNTEKIQSIFEELKEKYFEDRAKAEQNKED